MPKYLITIESTHVLELPELDEATREYISEHYEAATLPPEYEHAEYRDGSITYEEVEE